MGVGEDHKLKHNPDWAGHLDEYAVLTDALDMGAVLIADGCGSNGGLSTGGAESAPTPRFAGSPLPPEVTACAVASTALPANVHVSRQDE